MDIELAKMSAQEKKWRAEEDARLLKNYFKIRQDKERMNMAMEILEEDAKLAKSILDGTKAIGIF